MPKLMHGQSGITSNKIWLLLLLTYLGNCCDANDMLEFRLLFDACVIVHNEVYPTYYLLIFIVIKSKFI